uniref:Putative calcium-hydrogen exchanger 5 n=1 Tax=Ganoderma lucidum TaxID=5315 RepID=A0A2R3YBL0_GANLU|nr:putative calcium-hydrogen exchanger 5 [Ganoderma lucidum]
MPPKPVGPAPPLWKGLKAIILMSWINVLLVFIPISWACHFALPKNDKNDTLTFVCAYFHLPPPPRVELLLVSFLAIIPLAKLLAFATDELSMRVGQTLAGLLNATLLNSSLLTISVIAVLLPAAFHTAAGDQIPDDIESKDILAVSHGDIRLYQVQTTDGVCSQAAIILLVIYLSYLVFQLFSHKDLYDDNHPDIFKSTKYQGRLLRRRAQTAPAAESAELSVPLNRITSGSLTGSPPSSPPAGHTNLPHDTESAPVSLPESEEEEEETPQMSVGLTIGLLVVVTVVVAVTAEWLVDSIDGMTDSGKISKEFVGLILLPIVGNAAEHVTAVTVSVKDKLTLSLGVAVGSSIVRPIPPTLPHFPRHQIALFVIPFIVTLAWIMGKPLSLLFDPFESIVLFLSVLVVNYVVQDGKSNWLEGMILMCLYVIIAITFWYYPGTCFLLADPFRRAVYTHPSSPHLYLQESMSSDNS